MIGAKTKLLESDPFLNVFEKNVEKGILPILELHIYVWI